VVCVRRAMLVWAIWLALVPLAVEVARPPKAEAQALPLVLISGVSFPVSAPVVLAVLALAGVAYGSYYCATNEDCATLAQDVIDNAPAWFATGLLQAVNSGAGVYDPRQFAGYDWAELGAGLDTAAHPFAGTIRTVPGTTLPLSGSAEPITIATFPSATYGTGSSIPYWRSPELLTPYTDTSLTGAPFTPAAIYFYIPTGGVRNEWSNGSIYCAATPTVGGACTGTAARNADTAGATTWPTTGSVLCLAVAPGNTAQAAIAAYGTGGTFTVEVSDIFYRYNSGATCGGVSVGAWHGVAAMAGTSTLSGYSGLRTGAASSEPPGNIAIPAGLGGLVGVDVTPDTQVTTVRGGTVPLGGSADVVGAVNTGFLGLSALMLRVATAVETVATWVSDFPAQLESALTTALGGALSAAFVPEVALNTRVEALSATVAARPPVSFVVAVQDAWDTMSEYGSDCPELALPYEPWGQTGFEMCLPEGVQTWTFAFSRFVAAAALAMWAWGFYRRVIG